MSNTLKKTATVVINNSNLFPRVRDQGHRPLCAVFAVSDLNSRANEMTECLSIEYLAHHGYLKGKRKDYSKGFSFKALADVVSIDGQPMEDLLPYDGKGLKPSLPLKVPVKLFHSKEIIISKKTIITELRNLVNAESAVAIGVRLTKSFFTPAAPFIFDDENDYQGNHAIVIVGYKYSISKGLLFLFKNSWGTGWAHGGYGLLTERFIENNIISVLVMEKK